MNQVIASPPVTEELLQEAVESDLPRYRRAGRYCKA